MNSIKTRLTAALAISLLATLAMATVLYFGARGLDQNAQRTRKANDEARELFSFALVAHRYMGAFGQSLGQRTLVANNERRVAARDFEGRIRNIPATASSWTAHSLNWNELRIISQDLSRELQTADSLRAEGKFYDAERVFNLARKTYFEQRMLPWFERAIDVQRSQVEELEATALGRAQTLRTLGTALSVLSALIAAIALVATLRAVIKPVGLLVAGARALEGGDFAHRISHQGSDELGVLAERFNDMAQVMDTNRRSLMEQNSKLEEAYKLQGEFLSMMSHELRSPLNTIIGYTELVLEDGAGFSEQAQKNVRSIAMGARRLLSLINDILDFSKLKAGKMQVRDEEFRVSELCRVVVEDAKALVHGRALAIELETAGELGTMRTDETKVRQILTNLMSNAVKFTDQGQVTLGVERGDSGQMSFVIKDSGIGVPEEQLSLIFEPFRQAKGTDRRAVGGTGLGLAIVARLSGLLGGNVSVKSEVGKGTEFTVQLPSQRVSENGQNSDHR